MKKIIIAGGSGYLGKCLERHYANKGYEIVIPSGIQQKFKFARCITWDAEQLGKWTEELEGAQALINLTGKSVDCRYNAKNKRLILESRVNSTRALAIALQACENPPVVWVNASSATYYRHAEDREMDEKTGEAGTGFSVDVVKAWEQEVEKVELPKTRKVIARTGIVLGEKSPAFNRLVQLVKIGLGGKMGNGNQYISWLHEQDFCRPIDYFIASDSEGVYNVTGPKPTPNTDFMRALRKQVKAPVGIPSPKWMLEIGAFVLRTETELILKSRRVVPRRLQSEGFAFQFNTVNKIFNHLVH